MWTRSTSTKRLGLLLILALLLPLSGCTEAAKARFEANQKRMQRKQAERMLEERARERELTSAAASASELPPS